jgi:hypothetical protein
VLSDEASWLAAEIRRLSRVSDGGISWRALRKVPDATPSEGLLAIASDDSGHPRLRATLQAALAKVGGRRCLLLLWGEHPDLRPLRDLLPAEVLYLPSEADRLAATLTTIVNPPALEDLTRHLVDNVPPALRTAVREVLERSGDPAGDPPPNNTVELATKARVDRPNLSRVAKEWDAELRVALDFARTRWILASLRERNPSIPDLARIMGYANREPLRPLLHRTIQCTLSQAWRVDPEVVVGPLLGALGKAVRVDAAG